MGVPERQRSPRRWSCEDTDLYVIDPGRVRRARNDQDFSQRELAELCGCSQNAIHLIESGRTRWVKEKLSLAIARRLKKPWEYFFSSVPVIGVHDVTSAADSDLQEMA